MVIERAKPRGGQPSAPQAGGVIACLLTDIRVLPTVTSVRFAVLVLMLAASSGSIYAAIGLLVTPGLDPNASRCTADVASNAGKLDIIVGRQQAVNSLICEIPYTGRIVGWSMSGVVLVVIATIVAYKLTPLWAIRWTRPWSPVEVGPGLRLGLRRPWWIPRRGQRLEPLSQDERYPDQRMMLERIRELCAAAGLSEEPLCLLRPHTRRINPSVLRHRRRYVLLLPAQLWRVRSADPAVFDGLVLHELGHVRNRDNRPTYVTYAAWRAFVALALAPYLVALALSPRTASINSHLLCSIAVLTILLYLTRNAVLRVRETHADASAAVIDESATRAALTFGEANEPAARFARPSLLSHHPSYARRLRDLDGASGLLRPDGWPMLAAGIAASLAVANVQWTIWFAVLSSSWLADSLVPNLVRGVVVGKAGPAFELIMVMNGLTMLLSAALFAGFACTTMWRARLAEPATARSDRMRVLRYAVPWAAGYLLGEPLSVIDAMSGFWGVVDRSAGTEAIDFAASGLIIVVVSALSFQWAAESAAAWIPVVKGSLRRACARAAVVGAMGTWPALLPWLLYHNGQFIRQVVTVNTSPKIADWPLRHLAFSEYVPPGFMIALPGAVLCMALPALFVHVGLLRRPSDVWPGWMPADASDAAGLLRSRDPVTGLLKRGLLLAAASAAGCLSAVLIVRFTIGASAVDAGRSLGAYRYFFESCVAVNTLVVGVVAALIGRRARTTPLCSALITVLTATTLAAPLLWGAVYVGACGRGAWGCFTSPVGDKSYVYGEIAAHAPVYGAIVAIVLLALGAFRAAKRPLSTALERSTSRGRTSDVTALVAVFIALSITAYVVTDYIFTAHAAFLNGISLLR